MGKNKEKILSTTKNDLIVQTFRAGGKGGQHQNKKDTGVRIIHQESEARGEAREQRSQRQNRKIALERLVNSKEFQVWHKKKVSEIMMSKEEIKRKWEEWLNPKNFKIEIYDKDKKKYVEWEEGEITEDDIRE